MSWPTAAAAPGAGPWTPQLSRCLRPLRCLPGGWAPAEAEWMNTAVSSRLPRPGSFLAGRGSPRPAQCQVPTVPPSWAALQACPSRMMAACLLGPTPHLSSNCFKNLKARSWGQQGGSLQGSATSPEDAATPGGIKLGSSKAGQCRPLGRAKDGKWPAASVSGTWAEGTGWSHVPPHVGSVQPHCASGNQ